MTATEPWSNTVLMPLLWPNKCTCGMAIRPNRERWEGISDTVGVFFRLNPKMCTFFVQTPKVVGNTWFDELIYDYLLMNLASFTWQYDAVLNNCKAFLWERVPENKLQGTQSGEFDLSWLWQQADPLRTFNCQCVSFWEKCSARWACWCFQKFHGSMTSWGC